MNPFDPGYDEFAPKKSSSFLEAKPHELKFDISKLKYFVDRKKSGIISQPKSKDSALSISQNNSLTMGKLNYSGVRSDNDKTNEKISDKASSSKSSFQSSKLSQDSKGEKKEDHPVANKKNHASLEYFDLTTKNATTRDKPFQPQNKNLKLSLKSLQNVAISNKTPLNINSVPHFSLNNAPPQDHLNLTKKANSTSISIFQNEIPPEQTKNDEIGRNLEFLNLNENENEEENEKSLKIKKAKDIKNFLFPNVLPSINEQSNTISSPNKMSMTGNMVVGVVSQAGNAQKTIKYANYSYVSNDSTTAYDSENITNTLTSSNSGHLENLNTFLLGKSDLNCSGKLDTSGSENPNSARNNPYNKYSFHCPPQSNTAPNKLLEKLGVSHIHPKQPGFFLNQTMTDFRGGKDVSNKYMNVSSFLNKSMNFEGCEIQEEYDQEEENLIGKEIKDEINFTPRPDFSFCNNNSSNNNSIHISPTEPNSNNLSFFKENPRHKKKTEDEDSTLFEINTNNIEADGRTTLMIKNIPNKYNIDLMLQAINANYKDKYDFFYLPIDFRNKCNVGYAFINFIEPLDIKYFYEEFSGKKWEKFNSEKICVIKYARIQGRNALIQHFKSSSVMNQKDKKLRPLILPEKDKFNIERIIKQQRENITKYH